MQNQDINKPRTNKIVYKLRLFTAGKSPNSIIAIKNLNRLCETHGTHQYDIETVDIMDNPRIALENGIFLTPALQIIAPEPGTIIYGNLSDQAQLKNLF